MTSNRAHLCFLMQVYLGKEVPAVSKYTVPSTNTTYHKKQTNINMFHMYLDLAVVSYISLMYLH